MFHELHVLGMNDNLWDRFSGLGSENWLLVVLTHLRGTGTISLTS